MTKNYANVRVLRQAIREYEYRRKELEDFMLGKWGRELKDNEACLKGNELCLAVENARNCVEKYALRLLLRHKGKNDKLCARIMSLLERKCAYIWVGIRKNCM